MENTTKNDIVKKEESVTEVEMNKSNSQSSVDALIEFNSPPVDALIGFKEETEEKIGQFKKRVKEGVEVANQVLKEQEETFRSVTGRCIVTSPIRERQNENSQSPVDAIPMDTSFVREFTTEELAELKEETKEKIGQFKKAVKEGIELANQTLKEQEETKSFSVTSTFAVNEKIRAIMARCIVTAPIRGRQKDIGEIDVLLFLDPYHDIASLIMLLNGKKANGKPIYISPNKTYDLSVLTTYSYLPSLLVRLAKEGNPPVGKRNVREQKKPVSGKRETSYRRNQKPVRRTPKRRATGKPGINGYGSYRKELLK